ncbi:hypothetical protein Q5762_00385 [Streptomyces sp. P9(2023)]|uniref:hypothetical protein n=1 Tax=Streptomyces sp. P9(2023) TaxID=3064394 RepID=UPI0028F45A4E|nr:hypothetical protein [Streptomyces sp. P9(2023)]MDT9686832.1 hypothetical protein [Streptomyces sp. P9(2023)]
MTKLLLSIHVLASILVVGPITVAASMFPRYARQASPFATLLHQICRGYAVAGVAVPVFGLATAIQLGVLTDAWLLTSLALTAVAAAVLALAILPGQRLMLAGVATGGGEGGDAGGADPGGADAGASRAAASRLAMVTGVFNLLWTVVVVLMIVRPGSTTGA